MFLLPEGFVRDVLRRNQCMQVLRYSKTYHSGHPCIMDTCESDRAIFAEIEPLQWIPFYVNPPSPQWTFFYSPAKSKTSLKWTLCSRLKKSSMIAIEHTSRILFLNKSDGQNKEENTLSLCSINDRQVRACIVLGSFYYSRTIKRESFRGSKREYGNIRLY